jgi:predicted DsbA family dithiol-disulfide isomerase
MTANPHTLRVDIWSDIICPFCWIGKRQFEIALKDFAGRDKVEVHYHAFRLSPDQPVTPVRHMLQLKYRIRRGWFRWRPALALTIIWKIPSTAIR